MTIEETRERWLLRRIACAGFPAGPRRGAPARVGRAVRIGGAARGLGAGDERPERLILLDAIDAEILEAIARRSPAFRTARRVPRILAPEFAARSRDVFPIELLDISDFHVVLHGAGPGDLSKVDHEHLRMQCEREIREKLMRLHERTARSTIDPTISPD